MVQNNIENSRFKDLRWAEEVKYKKVLIVGAGGIGSYLTFFLSRAGFQITVMDNDIIERHNIGGQLYSFNDVGSYKSENISNFCLQYSNNEIQFSSNRYNENNYIRKQLINYDIIVSAVDNMTTRKLLFDDFLNTKNSGKTIFIDGRLSAESYQIYSLLKKDDEKIKKYKESLFEDTDVKPEPCTAKATSHMGGMIASHMVSLICNHVVNITFYEMERPVPFMTSYFSPLNIFKNE